MVLVQELELGFQFEALGFKEYRLLLLKFQC